MKTISVLTIAAFMILMFSGSRLCLSQTVAVGHISAEVIESVSAASKAVSVFEVTPVTVAGALVPEVFNTSEVVGLGVMTVNSGRDITCNVVVRPASLADSSGNGFTLAPFVKNESLAGSPDGLQTVELGGRTRMAGNQPSGLYQGSYTVVFAYN